MRWEGFGMFWGSVPAGSPTCVILLFFMA
jgi:hypothetical protein